ncbi:uncharacterized protein LOC135395325 isoform X2 [Ornithodoros turicata]
MLSRAARLRAADGNQPCVCFIKHTRLQRRPRLLRCLASETWALRDVLHCRATRWGALRNGCGSRSDDIWCERSVISTNNDAIERNLEPAAVYLACLYPACQHCRGGFSSLATCFTLRTAPVNRSSFVAVKHSPFLLEVKWKGVKSKDQYTGGGLLQAQVCWDSQPCIFQCFQDQVPASSGSYELPADLTRFSVNVELLRARKPLFYYHFERGTVEPGPPCEASVQPFGSSSIKLSWRPLGHFDGYRVSWCPIVGPCSFVHVPNNISSVILSNMPPFRRYHYKIETYRSYPNSSRKIYSKAEMAPWKVHSIYEIVMYLKMLVEFLMAAVLCSGGFSFICYVVAVRIHGGVIEEEEEDDHSDTAQHGDHRRIRRRPRRPARVHSRGDS